MSGNPKFAILEKDGVEYPTPTEYEALSEDIYYDGAKSETVKDRFDTHGFGYGMYFKNVLDRDFTIPSGRTLIVSGFIDLNGFELDIEGGLEISL